MPTNSHASGRGRKILNRVIQIVVITYAALILVFVYLTKDLTLASLARDPLFAGYSVAVVFYVLSRFAFSLFYRPYRDTGYQPTVSIVIPAFNEEECIADTIRSCLSVEYPSDRLEVIAVNDGSTDATWERMAALTEDHPELHAVDLGRNYGKRAAMAEGIRRSTGEVICFVDSDSYLERDAVQKIAQPFADPKVGAVVGHADVANSLDNWLTKMQQVRYFAAFRVMKGTESILGGTVTCASGCCSAYRRADLMDHLEEWEFQQFLGRPATFGDDRALTNRVLQTKKVVYQETARAHTVVPDTLRKFLRQQLRWKKSWLRESLHVSRYFWKKHPVAALLTYASIAFPFIAPFVVLRAVGVRLATGSTGDGMWFYLIGTYAMALLYSLYYATKRQNGLWHHGLSFVGIYMVFLVFQTYWAMATMRDNRWGTRDSTVLHDRVNPELVTVLAPSGGPTLTTVDQAPQQARVEQPARRGHVAWEGGAA